MTYRVDEKHHNHGEKIVSIIESNYGRGRNYWRQKLKNFLVKVEKS